MLLPAKSFIRDKYPIIAILILASFVRFYKIDYFLISHDGGRAIFEALNMIESREWFVPISISYVAIPFYQYLIAFPLLLYKNLYSVVIFFTILNIASVYVCYRIGKDFFSKNVGIISSFLYAVFPYSVVFLRGTPMNSYILPIFVSLFFYFLLSITSRMRSGNIFPSCIFLLACIFLLLSTQIHPSTYCFIPVAVTYLFVSRPKAIKKQILIALLFLSILFIIVITKLEPSSFSFNWNILQPPPQTGENSIHRFISSYVLLLKGTFFSLIELFKFPIVNYFTEQQNTFITFGILFGFISDLEVMIFLAGSGSLFYWMFLKKWKNKKGVFPYGIFAIWFLYLFLVPLEIYCDRSYCNVEESSLYNPEMFNSESYSDVTLRYLIPIFPLPFLIIAVVFSKAGILIDKRLTKKPFPFVPKRKRKIILFLILIFYAILKIMACGVLFNDEQFLEITTRNKYKIIDSLYNDFGIKDFETYRKKVSFVGTGSFFDGGYDVLFYFKSEFAKTNAKAGLNENNILIVRDRFAIYLKDIIQKIDILQTKDVGQALLIEYDLADDAKCDGRCVLGERTVEFGKDEFFKIKIEIDKETYALYVTTSSSPDFPKPEHICLTYGTESCPTEYIPIKNEGELKIDMPSRYPFIKEGFNIIEIRAIGDLFSKSVMYVIFQIDW